MNETKTCPFCSEEVHINAKKCKHCGETIDVALRAAEEAKRSSERASPANVYMNAANGGNSTPQLRPYPWVAHLLLTLCTGLLWLPIWILAYFFRNRNVYY